MEPKIGYYQLTINVPIVKFDLMLKQIIKRGTQHFAARFGPQNRMQAQPQLLILMYHRIIPENDERTIFEEPGMTVSPTTFRHNLETIAKYFEFVSLTDWLERKQKSLKLPQKACAITFDDGWADNYEFAYPVLKDNSVPATIFIVSDMIGTDMMFWPERLARLASKISKDSPQNWDKTSLQWLRQARTDYTFSNIPPTREQLTQLIAHAKKNSDQSNHALLDKIEQELKINIQPPTSALLSWNQLTEMDKSGLIEIGSHTCTHTRLTSQISMDKLASEIVNSKLHIESRLGEKIKTFCFPNGDYSAAALDLVKQTYIGAVTTEHGWNSIDNDSYHLRRIGIHEDIAKDKIAFLARISGWLR